jgi:hypothetical protein
MVIRGGNEGGLDGIDVWGTNIWVHDVEVTNKDECVTVKVYNYQRILSRFQVDDLLEPCKLHYGGKYLLQLVRWMRHRIFGGRYW